MHVPTDRLVAPLAPMLESPDLGLEQLIVNAIQPNETCSEVFHAQADVMAQGLTRYLEALVRARMGSSNG
ncbi:hypothetical protein [Roseateles sp.]|uniref:hypothetical protein n=1 Tax=Roseateles sp. TaxID=1971397 RepID=UPI0039EA0F1C